MNTNCTTISGIETVNKLLATTNNQEVELFSDAFKKGAASSIYIDLEYDTLDVSKCTGWDSFNGNAIAMIILFSVLNVGIILFVFAGLAHLNRPAWKSIAILAGIGICSMLIQIMVWQGLIKVA